MKPPPAPQSSAKRAGGFLLGLQQLVAILLPFPG